VKTELVFLATAPLSTVHYSPATVRPTD